MMDKSKMSLLDLVKAPGMLDKYRKWAANPDTAQFLALAADLVSANPSTPETRAIHSEAVAMLVRRETAEEFMLACLRLEQYANLAGDTALPPSDYGAKPPKKTKKPETAAPAQA